MTIREGKNPQNAARQTLKQLLLADEPRGDLILPARGKRRSLFG